MPVGKKDRTASRKSAKTAGAAKADAPVLETPVYIPCLNCNGTGNAVPDCETCEGNGWVEDPEDGGTMTCPDCNGDKCDYCDGEGLVPAKAGA